MQQIKDRRHYAQQLAQIAMKLQRTPKKDQETLLAAADNALNGYRIARIAEQEKPQHRIEGKAPEGLELAIGSLADVIAETLAPNGYLLLVFSKDADGPLTSFTTNADMDDACKAMAELITAHVAASKT